MARSRSTASTATVVALSKPMVRSLPHRSLSIVEATPHRRPAGIGERGGPALAAVATDHHQAVDPGLAHASHRFGPNLRILEGGMARRAEHRPRLVHDAADVPSTHRLEAPCDQAREAVANTGDLQISIDANPRDGAYRRVHAWRVASAGEHRDVPHRATPDRRRRGSARGAFSSGPEVIWSGSRQARVRAARKPSAQALARRELVHRDVLADEGA